MAIDQTVVLFGNRNPQMTHDIRDDSGAITRHQRRADHLHQAVTRVEMRPDFDDREHVELALSTDNDRLLSLVSRALPDEHHGYELGVYELEQIVQVHSGGVRPAWVSSNDEAFARALGHHFGCPVGQQTMLITNAGRDALHAQHLTTSAQPAAFFYGALSANSGAGFAASDTTLAGEIATASGGLIRAAMTYAHTAGTNTSTLTKTWAANASDSLPVTIASWANFNAASSGTIGEENALNATATLTVIGDSLTVTFTLTAG